MIIGQAAHICGAAPGAPRYDETMTEEDRSSIENGIWLCNNCARKIDRDIDSHPVSLLKSWKAESERLSIQQLDKSAAEHNIILDGISLITGKNIYDRDSLVPNVHIAYEKYLKALDPRFDPQVDYINGNQRITLNKAANTEPAEILCTVEDTKEAKKIEEVFLFGGEAEISHPSLSITGSPLLNSCRNGEIKSLLIAQEGRETNCDINIFTHNKRKILLTIKSKCKIYSGIAGIRLQFNALDGLLKLTWSFDLRNNSIKKKKFTKLL